MNVREEYRCDLGRILRTSDVALIQEARNIYCPPCQRRIFDLEAGLIGYMMQINGSCGILEIKGNIRDQRGFNFPLWICENLVQRAEVEQNVITRTHKHH